MPPRSAQPKQPTPEQPTPAETVPASGSQPDESARHLSLAHLPVPHVGVPRVRVPAPPVTGTRGRVLWWGGLATVAAVGVLDWPVAVAIAAGSYVAERRARAGREETPSPRDATGGEA